VAALILLDLSAASDTVDYEISLQRLQITYSISDIAHRWFRSYLLDRSQYVRIGTSCSSVIDLICGVPQGSVLGPVLFILSTAGLISLIESHGLTPHLYANDTQVYGLFPASNVDAFSAKLTACSCAVASWMQSNRLRLNSDKTEVMWCAMTRCEHQLPRSPLLVDGTPMNPVQSVCNLGIFVDADLVFLCEPPSERSLKINLFAGIMISVRHWYDTNSAILGRLCGTG